jgi:hypothetical protein
MVWQTPEMANMDVPTVRMHLQIMPESSQSIQTEEIKEREEIR